MATLGIRVFEVEGRDVTKFSSRPYPSIDLGPFGRTCSGKAGTGGAMPGTKPELSRKAPVLILFISFHILFPLSLLPGSDFRDRG